MNVAHKTYGINQEMPLKRVTALSTAFTLIAAIALSVLLGIGVAFAAGAVLKVSIGISLAAQLSAAFGAMIGVIICISKNNIHSPTYKMPPHQSSALQEMPPLQPPSTPRSNFAPVSPRLAPPSPRWAQSPYRSTNSPRSQETPTKAEYFPVIPIKGQLGGVRLSAIHKLKLMSTPVTPSKRKQYRCMIVFKSGKEEVHMFNANVYNAFLKFLPYHKKDTY